MQGNIAVTCTPSEVTAEAPHTLSDSSDKNIPTKRLIREEEVTCRTPIIDKKVTAKSRGQVTAPHKTTTDKKTARTPMTRRKKQQIPDKNQRKLTDLLNFWQKDKPDSTVTEKGDSQDKKTPRTTQPRVTVGSSTIKENVGVTVDKKEVTVSSVTVEKVDSPVRTRIADIKRQFRTRLTANQDHHIPKTPLAKTPVTATKRKVPEGVTEPESDRATKLRVTEKSTQRESRAAAQGPVLKTFISKFEHLSKLGAAAGGLQHREREAPGRQAEHLEEGRGVNGSELSVLPGPTGPGTHRASISVPEQLRGGTIPCTKTAAVSGGTIGRMVTASHSQGTRVQWGKTGFSWHNSTPGSK